MLHRHLGARGALFAPRDASFAVCMRYFMRVGGIVNLASNESKPFGGDRMRCRIDCAPLAAPHLDTRSNVPAHLWVSPAPRPAPPTPPRARSVH